ncbi:hypothetical protein BU17DRAFT_26503, partial [Hysterangium stoloniferum]
LLSIVAIHGLDGHRELSWAAENGRLWLRDFLPSKLPHARIVTYGYNTVENQSNSMEIIHSQGHNFISRLALFRDAMSTKTRPIIFLAHSLGGIILKSALIHASHCHKSHLSHHKQIVQATYGVVFLATPHQGTAIAELASQLLRVSLPQKSTMVYLFRDLASNASMFEIMLSEYNAISANFVTKFFYEVHKTTLVDGQTEFV